MSHSNDTRKNYKNSRDYLDDADERTESKSSHDSTRSSFLDEDLDDEFNFDVEAP